MSTNASGVRRVFIGKAIGVIFGLLVAGTLLIPDFIPWYVSVLFASGIRNIFLPQLGYGPLFFAVAVLILYAQAVALTAVYLVGKVLYHQLEQSQENAETA